MLRINQRFDKNYNCYLQCECVIAGRFWNPSTEQAAVGEFDLMVLIDGAKERSKQGFQKRPVTTYSL
jgi:hypothetical protein